MTQLSYLYKGICIKSTGEFSADQLYRCERLGQYEMYDISLYNEGTN